MNTRKPPRRPNKTAHGPQISHIETRSTASPPTQAKSELGTGNCVRDVLHPYPRFPVPSCSLFSLSLRKTSSMTTNSGSALTAVSRRWWRGWGCPWASARSADNLRAVWAAMYSYSRHKDSVCLEICGCNCIWHGCDIQYEPIGCLEICG
ncbi:hypothetical protein BDW22DRAFT_122758 [Trametopsis cervina]|nr:hypothetical protein BDW22DRAFT_122758 [Trametopsis cervina]